MSAARLSRSGSASQGVLTFAATVANSGLSFLVIVIVGRGLGVSAAGQFFAVTAVFVFSTSLLNFGADTGLVRTLSRLRALGQSNELGRTVTVAIAPAIVIGTLLGVLIAILLPHVGYLLHLSSGTAATLRWLGLLLVPAALLAILLGGTRGLGQVAPFALVQNVSVPALRVLAVLIVVLTVGGISATVWAWATPVVVGAGIAAVLLRRALSATRRDSVEEAASAKQPVRSRRKIAREFWGFSSARGISMVLERAIDQSDVILILAMLGSAAGGAYGAVARCVMVGAMVQSSIAIVMGPKISAALATEDHERAEQYFHTVARNLILMAWPFYLLLAIYADRVLQLFGTGFDAASGAMRVVCVGMMISNAAGMLQTFLLMGGKSRWQVGNRVAQWITLVVGVLVLSPLLGLTGAGLAWTLAILVDTVLAATQVYRAFGLRNRLGSVARAATFPLALGACALVVSRLWPSASVWVLAAPTVALLVGYLGCLYLTRNWLGLDLGSRNRGSAARRSESVAHDVDRDLGNALPGGKREEM